MEAPVFRASLSNNVLKQLARSIRIGKLATSVMVACLLLAVQGRAQTIIQHTERALPGEPIDIQGDGIADSPQVQFAQVGSDGTVGSWQNAEILANELGSLQATAPKTLSPGLWALQVKSKLGVSNQALINLPEIFFLDSEQASPGETISIYGRNLQALGGSNPGYVKLVPPSGASLTVKVVSASPYNYTVQVPSAAQPGTVYSVVLNNGYGGQLGEVKSDTSLKIQPARPDPFNLGVWWGQQYTFASNVYNVRTDPRLSVHAVGDGVAEDHDAVQAAIITAQRAGGGVVYFPAGTYRVGGDKALSLFPNVVLKGDGPGHSILTYGYNWTDHPAPRSLWAIRLTNTSLTGLYGLTIQNLNPNKEWNQTILLSSQGAGVNQSDRVFIANCDVQLGNGYAVRGLVGTHILVKDSTIETTSVIDAALNLTGSMFVTIENNTITFRNGRIRLPYTSNVVVKNNTFNRDNTFMTPTAVETGALEVSSARLIAMQNNTIAGIGPFPNRWGCGEMINSQRSNTPDEEDLGQVTSATPLSLTNSSAHWTTTTPFSVPGYGLYNRANVAIVAGKGAGQWRTILSNTSDTVTIDKPWVVTPDSTSTYTIGFWAADRQLMLGNKISNSTIGISIFTGGLDCVADSNQLTNAGRIMLRCDDALHDVEVVPGPMKGRRHSIGWGNWISNNTVTNTSGDMPAAISVYAVNVDGVGFGNLLWGTEVRGNTINALLHNTNHPDEAGSLEGYWNHTVMWHYTKPDPFSNLGTLFIDNNAVNIDKPYNLPGSSLTRIAHH